MIKKLKIFVIMGLFLSVDGSVLLHAGTAGSIVSAFGDHGVMSLVVPGTTGSTKISGFSLSSDGSFFAGGFAGERGKDGIFIGKYSQDGSLIRTFGEQGIVFTSPFDGPLATITSGTPCSWDTVGIKVIPTSGKIVVAAHIYNQGASVGLGLGRYNPDGTPDTSFGMFAQVGSGTRNGFLGMNKVYPYALAVQRDEKIVVGGSAADDRDGNNVFALIRCLPDGKLDASFGNRGVVKFDPFPLAQQRIYDIAIQPDGKILTTGIVTTKNLYVIVTCRFNADGSIDENFNAGTEFSSPGYVVATPGDSELAVAFKVALQPDGKIVVAGYGAFQQQATPANYNTSSNLKLAVLRYNPDGSPDQTFGFDGMVTTKVGEWGTMPFGLAIQKDGKIVVAARATFYAKNGTFFDTFATVRYRANGTLDTTFGPDTTGLCGIPGIVVTTFSSDAVMPQALLLLPGKIMLGGYGMNSARGFYDGLITQYNQ